jgi:2-methylaconitate cis-trans-isomerase PrpF
MRGGTSKGLFFLDSDLPSESELRNRTLLAAFGSPDPRQIDGLGGADPLTSKLAIIRPSTLPEVDLEYTFGQVSVSEAFIDFSANCGNISSAVGPFAMEKGLVTPEEPLTRVRILNTNTGKMIDLAVPFCAGEVLTEGTYRIDGVPGSGAEIELRFLDPGGGATGKLLPTGNPRDSITLQDGRTVDVSIVDAGNPAGFVRADQIGLRGDELPEQIESCQEILAVLEELRAKISEILGLCSSWGEAYQHYTSIPKIVFVAQPSPFRTLQGGFVEAPESWPWVAFTKHLP